MFAELFAIKADSLKKKKKNRRNAVVLYYSILALKNAAVLF